MLVSFMGAQRGSNRWWEKKHSDTEFWGMASFEILEILEFYEIFDIIVIS